MNVIKFKCDDREYKSWNIYDANTLTNISCDSYNINPIRDKLFNQDVILVDDEGTFKEIVHSSNREMCVLPGVMIFDKMYGKTNNNKYYFKVIPDDKRLPIFLVAYKPKNANFHKKMNKKYVIFKFNNWEQKHPIGDLIHTIGDVSELSNFYEYQLYCKSLYASIQDFSKKAKQTIRKYSDSELTEQILNCEKFNIEDRRDWNVISIDPEKSKDFDDAFSLKELDKSQDKYLLSIYISNVTIWMEFLGLWSSFSERISTIYLPDRKRPMLPTILSDMLCSLLENETRFTFACDIVIQNKKIESYDFKNAAVKVTNNYVYEDKRLFNDKTYLKTLDLISRLNKDVKFRLCDEIIDSHDVVMFLMILMNYLSAKKFTEFNTGIFRSIKLDYNNEIKNKNLPNDVTKFLMTWNSSGGQYLKYENYERHDILRLDAYVHITSPIRRLVDLLNMIQIQNELGIFKKSEESSKFYEYWVNDEKIEYINTSMRAIRRMQNQCELLDKCVNNPKIMESPYEGYVFDKIIRNDGLYQYLVYIPKLKLLNKYTSRYNHDNYTKHIYTLHLFEDEETFKKKIRFNFEV